MQKKNFSKGIGLFAALVAFMFVWVTSLPAEPEVPENIVINSSIWPKKKYEDTKLSHKKHAEEYKVECVDCHHVYKDGKNVWAKGQEVHKCSECHTNIKTGKALKSATAEEKKLSLYKAFHHNCKDCHKKEKKGPTKCKECHEKK